MPLIITMLCSTVLLVLRVYMILLLLRALLSWLPIDEENPIFHFVTGITEPYVALFRAIFDKSKAMANMPLDLSFLAAYISLYLIYIILMLFSS